MQKSHGVLSGAVKGFLLTLAEERIQELEAEGVTAEREERRLLIDEQTRPPHQLPLQTLESL
jgi:hypothetical protein